MVFHFQKILILNTWKTCPGRIVTPNESFLATCLRHPKCSLWIPMTRHRSTDAIAHACYDWISKADTCTKAHPRNIICLKGRRKSITSKWWFIFSTLWNHACIRDAFHVPFADWSGPLICIWKNTPTHHTFLTEARCLILWPVGECCEKSLPSIIDSRRTQRSWHI